MIRKEEDLKNVFNNDNVDESTSLPLTTIDTFQSLPPDPNDEVKSNDTVSQGLTDEGDLIITTGISTFTGEEITTTEEGDEEEEIDFQLEQFVFTIEQEARITPETTEMLLPGITRFELEPPIVIVTEDEEVQTHEDDSQPRNTNKLEHLNGFDNGTEPVFVGESNVNNTFNPFEEKIALLNTGVGGSTLSPIIVKTEPLWPKEISYGLLLELELELEEEEEIPTIIV